MGSKVFEVLVSVNSILKSPTMGLIIEASNGGFEGPPFIKFTLPPSEAGGIYIGKRYKITIEEIG